MKASIAEKIAVLVERYEELGHLLASPDVIADQNKFRDFSKEYAELEPMAVLYQNYQQQMANKTTAEEMLKSDDADMREMAEEEILATKQALATLEANLMAELVPKDPDDDNNVYLEVRAGTGGDEACLFAGDLYRMYSRYAEKSRWQMEVISLSEGEHGGYKEIISKISGQAVYARLKFESGAHRVQRVPQTESQGRIHTSACTVAILPEAKQVDAIDINPNDLKIDTYRASGAGGQHVNKTDSAVRITHLPSNTVVECQDERSQHKNKARAMSLLQARLLADERAKLQTERAQTRRDLVGSGDRSERIRTYNFPQGRMTDHRINLTLYKLDEIMQGELSQVIEPLRQEHQADQLAVLGE